MNRFEHHHRDAILFGYSCFDRMIFNGAILQFMHTKRAGSIRWFLRDRCQIEDVSRSAFAKISRDYHAWVGEYAQQTGLTILTPEKGVSREQLVEPYFHALGQQAGVAVILKARESERLAWHFAKTNQIAVDRRCVDLYYFYLNDAHCGRMFLRICPYFPFHITVWLNGHNWLKCQLQKENIAFKTRDNLFVACERPERLQELADAFAPTDIAPTVDAWLARLLPFFTDSERQIFRHQLFMIQMEYCHNLIFKKPAALDQLFGRLMDANRGLGRPDKLAVVFGRTNYVPDTRTGQTTLRVTKTRLPVLSSGYKQTLIKQYVKDGMAIRTESSSFQLKDLSIPKNLKNLPKVRQVMDRANQRYLNVQQDILASHLDGGQLEHLRQPSVSPSGRRVPGLHLDDPRLMAVLQAITCFAYLAGQGCFRTVDLLVDVQKALANPLYRLSQLRYDLSKLRGKGLVVRLPATQSYQLTPEGYQIAIVYLKFYQRLYAPLIAAIRNPVATDNEMLHRRQTKLDRLYVATDQALKRLAHHLGLAA